MESLPVSGSFVFAASIIPVGESFRSASPIVLGEDHHSFMHIRRVAPMRACDRAYGMSMLDGFNGCGKITRK